MAITTQQASQITPQHSNNFQFTVHDAQPWYCAASVTIPSLFVDRLYKLALNAQRSHVNAQGFAQHNAPLEYIAQTYDQNIFEHLQEFIFKYAVVNFLYEQMRTHKLFVAGDPRLSNVKVKSGQDAIYHFEFSLYPPLSFQEWKYFPFKAPKRKNYKDLDRQVEGFISEEQKMKEKCADQEIMIGDWVNFSLKVLADDGSAIFNDHETSFWIRIGDEEVDRHFTDIFNKKKRGDVFTIQNRAIQEFLSDPFATSYTYTIEILDVVHNSYFCFDLFKHHFRLKTNKELYQRFIEVYSYRNDLSLRRSMAEESLRVLLLKHSFQVPNYLTLRTQNTLLETVQNNPDYYVYRMQKDFKERIRELAYRQTQEQIFIDQLAYDENVNVAHQDIKSYLNLTLRPRTKEFIYFDPPLTKIRGQEIPIHQQELMRTCMREKTLNYIIYHLTKK